MNRFFPKIILSALCVLAFSLVSKAQAYKSYILDSTIAYKWENFNPLVPTEVLALAGEDEVYTVPLPFNFQYFDSTYSTMFVGLNGYVSFGRNYAEGDFNREKLCQPVTQLYNPAGEQNSLNPDNFIAVFWDDLFIDPACTPADGGTPKIAYRTIGTTPNREFIVVWDYMIQSGDLAPCAQGNAAFNSMLNVELRLFETSNVIEIHVKKNFLLEQGATIAVENAAGDYAVYANCGAGNNPGDAELAYRFTPSTNPPTGGGGGSSAGYCAANGEACALPALRWISGVHLSNISNISTCSDSGYTDFTNVAAAKMDTGTVYQLTVNVKNFGNAAYLARAWVDWNRDSIFNETNEMYPLPGTSIGEATGEGIYTTVLQAPDGTQPGLVRMRIRYMFATGNLTACGADNIGEVEDYHILVSAPTIGYCAAKGGDCDTAFDSASENYDHIVTATIQNDATDVVNNSGCDNGYGDFTANQNLWFGWTGGSQYQVVIKRKVFDYVFAQAAAYVDWNQDFDFDDLGEVTIGVANPADSTTIFLVNAPDTATIGITRLRLRTTSSNTGTAEPCGVQTLGEVEDYKVFVGTPIVAPPTCVSITIPADGATNLCQTQSLHWNKVASATGYKLKIWKENPVVVLADIQRTDTSYVIPTVLDTNSTYAWTVVPFNANGDAVNCDTMRFTISPDLNPSTTILPNSDTIFQCTSTPIVIDGNPKFGTQPYSHSWNGTNNSLLSDTAIANPTFAGASSGNFRYSYSLSDSKGCMAYDTVVISIIPAVEAGQLTALQNEFCAGGSTTLAHAGFVGNVIIQDSVTSQAWTTVNLSQPQANNYATGVLNATRYYRAIANAGSCSDTSGVIEIKVNPNPAPPLYVASGPTTFCFGDSVTFTVTNYVAGLTWNSTSSVTNNTATVKLAGDYFVTYTNPKGCVSKSATTTVTTNQSPNKPQIQILGNNNVCVGDPVVLYVNNPNNDALVWSDANATQNDTLVVYEPDSYTVTATAAGCSTTSDPVELFFNAEPAKPQIERIGSATPCEGETIYLVSSYTTNITWSNGSQEDTISVTATETFKVTYQVGNCVSTSDDVYIQFAAIPATPVITKVGANLVASVSGYTYQWIGPNGPIIGATGQSITPTDGGVYRVIVYTEEGCASQMSAGYVYSGTGLQELTPTSLSVYPNPVSNVLNVQSDRNFNGELALINSLGEIVFTMVPKGNQVAIDMNNFASGIYLLRYTGQNELFHQLVVKK